MDWGNRSTSRGGILAGNDDLKCERHFLVYTVDFVNGLTMNALESSGIWIAINCEKRFCLFYVRVREGESQRVFSLDDDEKPYAHVRNFAASHVVMRH